MAAKKSSTKKKTKTPAKPKSIEIKYILKKNSHLLVYFKRSVRPNTNRRSCQIISYCQN